MFCTPTEPDILYVIHEWLLAIVIKIIFLLSLAVIEAAAASLYQFPLFPSIWPVYLSAS